MSSPSLPFFTFSSSPPFGREDLANFCANLIAAGHPRMKEEKFFQGSFLTPSSKAAIGPHISTRRSCGRSFPPCIDEIPHGDFFLGAWRRAPSFAPGIDVGPFCLGFSGFKVNTPTPPRWEPFLC